MLSKTIKSMATQAGVKVKVRTHGTNVRVTFLSQPSNELVDQIKSLSTVTAHGDSGDDSRYYTGVAVIVSYQYPISAELKTQFETIKNNHHELTYHFKKEVVQKMGSHGQACLDAFLVK